MKASAIEAEAPRPFTDLSQVTTDVLIIIVNGMTWRSLVMASGTCRRLHAACMTKKIWRPLLLANHQGQRFNKADPTNAGLLYYHIFGRYSARSIIKGKVDTRNYHVDDAQRLSRRRLRRGAKSAAAAVVMV